MKSVAKKKTHLLLRNIYKGKKGKKNLEIKKKKKTHTSLGHTHFSMKQTKCAFDIRWKVSGFC